MRREVELKGSKSRTILLQPHSRCCQHCRRSVVSNHGSVGVAAQNFLAQGAVASAQVHHDYRFVLRYKSLNRFLV